MIYQALALKLKTGGIKEYIRHHDQIPSKWPKLQSALKESGILSIRTFEANPTLLFLFAEVTDNNAFERLWNTEAHKEWAEVMEPLMELNEEKKPDAKFMTQIFEFKAK
jgi:L-rhamnose mutarotase